MRLWLASIVALGACKGGAKSEPGGGARGVPDAVSLAAADASARDTSPARGPATAKVLANLEAACTAKDLESCRNLGVMLAEGLGIPADPARAVTLFTQACDGANLAACNNLASQEARGAGAAKDPARAATHFQAACDGGYALGCANLGVMLGRGDGVPVDAPRAAKLLDQACSLGAPDACTQAGALDAALAAKAPDGGKALYKSMLAHLTKGCDAHEAVACRQIGLAYVRGTGLPQSDAAAGVWLKKACDLHDPVACQAIGSGSGSNVGK